MAPIADEAHDRQRLLGGMAEHGRDAIDGHRPCVVLADHAHGLPAIQLQRLQDTEELVDIRHPAPAIAKILDAGRRLRRAGVFAGQWHNIQRAALSCTFKLRYKFLICIKIRGSAQMNLVHCLAARIEELQAATDIVAVPLFDREAVFPRFRKNAQVDLLAEHERGVLARLDILVDADLLMHDALVARQGHDLADRSKADQQIVHTRLDAQNTIAAMRRNKLGFGDAELRRKVSFAHLRIVDTRPHDRLRRRLRMLVHSGSYLFRMSFPCRVIFSL
jgi:hypothetical protein